MSTADCKLLAEDDHEAPGAHLGRPELDGNCERMARRTRVAQRSVFDVLVTSTRPRARASPGQTGTDEAGDGVTVTRGWCGGLGQLCSSGMDLLAKSWTPASLRTGDAAPARTDLGGDGPP
jgi:hypothetical protein